MAKCCNKQKCKRCQCLKEGGIFGTDGSWAPLGKSIQLKTCTPDNINVHVSCGPVLTIDSDLSAIEKRMDAIEEGGLMGPTGPKGPQGPPGEDGTVGTLAGSFESLEELINTVTHPQTGHFYMVGAELFFWDTVHGQWTSAGTIEGPQGATGPTGARGAAGPQGATGPAGEDGTIGTLAGSFDSLEELIRTVTHPQAGHFYLVGTELYYWDFAHGRWMSAGPIEGPQGEMGPQGPQGVAGPLGPTGPLGLMGPMGPAGEAGTIGTLAGSFESLEDLINTVTDPKSGNFYLVGNELYFWDPLHGQWISAGVIEGPQGPSGDKGPTGPTGPTGDTGQVGQDAPSLVSFQFSENPDGTLMGDAILSDGTVIPIENPQLLIGPQGGDAQVCLTNLCNGNNTGAIWGIHTATGYTMGVDAVAVGNQTRAGGDYSFAEGYQTEATGNFGSHAEGDGTHATGSAAHAQGRGSRAYGVAAHAGGYVCRATGHCAAAMGILTYANNDYTVAIGKCNQITPPSLNGEPEDNAFMIGNGTYIQTEIGEPDVVERSTAFRVQFDGHVFAEEYHSDGADYAEMFEWLDRNPGGEDRRGFFVTTEGDKIRKATEKDSYIMGVVSVNPTVVGDSHGNHWPGKYLRDEWGQVLYDRVWEPRIKDRDVLISESIQVKRPQLNPDYNPNQIYLPRAQRKEWAAVGIVGKVLVRDDGSCRPNGFCRPNGRGIATASPKGYRVLKRVGRHQVLIFLK